MFHFIEYPRLSNTNPAFMQSIPQKSKKYIKINPVRNHFRQKLKIWLPLLKIIIFINNFVYELF